MTDIKSKNVSKQNVLQGLFKRKKGLTSVLVLEWIGRHLYAVVGVKRDGRLRVKRYEEATLNMEEGADKVAFGKALGQKLREMKISEKNVILGVSRSEVMLRELSIPYVESEGEQAAMVQFQVTRDLPFRPEDAVIDFAVNGVREVEVPAENDKDGDGKKVQRQKQMDVSVAIVPRMLLNQVQQLTDAAGLHLVGLGFSASARMECLRFCHQLAEGEGKARLLLSLSADAAVIDIEQDGKLAFCSEVSLSFDKETDPLYSEDEELFAEYVEQVSIEVVRCLHGYEEDEEHSAIGKILVTDFGAQTERLVEALRRRIGISGVDVVGFYPAKSLGTVIGGSVEKKIGAEIGLCDVIGLAAEAMGRERLVYDFANPKKPGTESNGKVKRIAMVAAIVILLVCMFGIVRGQMLKEGRAECDALQSQISALSKNQKTWRLAVMQTLSTRAWNSGERHWMEHVAVLSSVLPDAEEAFVPSFSTGTRSNVVLSLRVSRSDAIAELESRLRELGYRLKSPAVTPVAGRSGYGFQTTMELVYPGKKSPSFEGLELPAERPEDDMSLLPIKEQKDLLKRAGKQPEVVAERPKAAPPERVENVPSGQEPQNGDNQNQRKGNRGGKKGGNR